MVVAALHGWLDVKSHTSHQQPPVRAGARFWRGWHNLTLDKASVEEASGYK